MLRLLKCLTFAQITIRASSSSLSPSSFLSSSSSSLFHHRALRVRWGFVETSPQCWSDKSSFLLHMRHLLTTTFTTTAHSSSHSLTFYIYILIDHRRRVISVKHVINVNDKSFCSKICFWHDSTALARSKLYWKIVRVTFEDEDIVIHIKHVINANDRSYCSKICFWQNLTVLALDKFCR